MIILKRLILLVSFLYITGCTTVGPTVLIETPEPADDFVVVCRWSKVPLLAIHGGGQITDEDVYVASSGKAIGCGSGVGDSASVKVMHPVYVNPEVINRDGVSVYNYSKTKLNILDEQKAKFEAGFFRKYGWPESRYADSVKVICWFPYTYFDYYRKVTPITLEYFKAQYYESILQCYSRVVPILKKYDKSYKDIKDAEEYVKGFWIPKKWEQFND